MDNFFLQSQQIDEVIENQNISSLKKEFKDISNKYRGEKINSSSVISNDKQALSYIASRMGETSTIIYDVLCKLNNVIKLEEQITSVLDLGCGTGSAFWALDNFVSKLNITAVEKQESMVKFAKLLSQPLSCNIEYINQDVNSKIVKQLPSFSLVIESFMLNEMNLQDRIKTLDTMVEKSENYIILIEPGTPNSYEKMMQDRDYLLSKGINLVLPCPHNKKCPIKDDYCNFSVRVNRTKTSRLVKDAKLGYEDEKYFYLIFSKQNNISAKGSVVLRKPVYRKSVVELKLCNQDCSICKTIITKNNKEHYLNAKKLKHGDIFKY